MSCWQVWDGSGRRTRSTRASDAARAQKQEIDSDVTSESVLRQKEACREAVEKCRAGRGAHIQWGRDQWYNTGLQQYSILRH